ncbi:uncharacterized protein [Apostichopus japonicus]|uniref:uncharacterized protein n=1 Tax=Stichopus japonicus TaxID=307972 RepID=UPI003AB282DA
MASSENPFASASNSGGNFSNKNTEKFRGDIRHQPRYSPNEQETRVLRDCQSESFWFRALPFGLLAGTGTFMLVQRGILTTKTRFGPLPKVLVAGFFGYLLGKVSYISTCKQKFLKLENSPIAEMIRKGASPGAIAASTQFGKSMEGFGSQNEADEGMFAGGSGGKSKVGGDYSENVDIDTSYSGQDVSVESFDQSSTIGPQSVSGEEKRPEMTRTYDQLRKENREMTSRQYREVLPGHFQKKQPQSQDAATSRPPVGRMSSTDDEFPLGRSKKLRKNAYGDLISDD